MKRSKTQLLRSLAAVMLLGAGLASCSQDDFADNRQGEPLPPGEYPLILNAGGLEAVATPAQQSAPSTRGTVDSDWDGVKSVAVMVNGKVKEYKVMRSGTDNKTAKLEVVDGDTPFYWESTAALAVEAWWPCTDKSNNFSDEEPAVVVQADQNKDDGYAKSDFIKAIDNVEFDNPTLTFTHLTAKVIVNLTWDKGFSEEEMNSAAISFINLNTQDGNPETITPFADKTKNTYFALLAGQEIEANKGFIQVSIGSGSSQRQYVYTPTAAKKLDKGTAYTYEITVRQTGLDVTVNESISWDEEGAEGSGSVEEIPILIDLSKQTGIYRINGEGNYLLTGTAPAGVGVIINGNANVTLSNANIAPGEGAKIAPISVDSGDPVFILEGENTLTSNYQAKAALYNAKGTIITIQGDGKLIATAAHCAAAIGGGDGDPYTPGNDYRSCGKIIIKSGTIEAILSSGAGATIGSGYGGECQGIEISGGTVVADASKGTKEQASCATIGSGAFGSCEYITLNNCRIYSLLGEYHSSVLNAKTITPSYEDINALKKAGVTIYVNDELYTK